MSSLSAAQKTEAVCTYAALLLHDAQKDITSANIQALAKAAGANVDKLSADIFAKFATPSLLDTLIEKLTTVGAVSGGAAATTTTTTVAPVEETKPESEEEEEEDAFGGLF
ncbi:hypothetical protein ABK040_006338 [Willaertia magna]